jgi:hypothetical protein
MAVNINVKLNADDSSVKKKLSELGKLAKKGLNFGGKDGTPSSSGKPSRASTILEKAMNDLAKAYKKEKQVMEKQGKARYAWEKAKFAVGKVGRFAGAAAEGVHTGASLLSRGTSGQSEYTSGGFMNSVHDKISTVQDTYSKAKEGYSSIKEAYKGQKEERDEQGNITKPARKGGAAAAMIAGIPVVGGAIGGLIGGIMQQVNDMGKEWTSVMASQQGTTGATGRYVGGGSGYFQNSQMAQSQIAYQRTQGKYGREKAENIGIQETKFASQQNIGIAQYTEQLGQIRENDKDTSTNFLRGAADINKMTGLKQGQFVAKLAQYSTAMKEAGFNKAGIRQFASLTGGLAQAGMKGERAFTVGQTLNEDVRKGVGGGVMSKLTLAKLMGQGKSYFQAEEQMQEEGLQNEETRKAYGQSLEMFSPEIRGQIMKGQVTRREAGLLTGKALESNISESSDFGKGEVGFNKSLDLTNKRMSSVAGSKAAAMSAQLGYNAAERQLKLFEKFSPGFEKVIGVMEKVEDKLFDGMDTLIEQTEKIVEFFEKAQKEGMFKTIGKEIGDSIKLPW